MKQLFPVLCLMLGFCSCSGGWSASDRKEFMGGCLKGAARSMDAARAKRYCDCMFTKLQQRYPSPVSTQFLQNDTAVYQMGRDCFTTTQP